MSCPGGSFGSFFLIIFIFIIVVVVVLGYLNLYFYPAQILCRICNMCQRSI
jgi:hypothetical protein